MKHLPEGGWHVPGERPTFLVGNKCNLPQQTDSVPPTAEPPSSIIIKGGGGALILLDKSSHWLCAALYFWSHFTVWCCVLPCSLQSHVTQWQPRWHGIKFSNLDFGLTCCFSSFLKHQWMSDCGIRTGFFFPKACHFTPHQKSYRKIWGTQISAQQPPKRAGSCAAVINTDPQNTASQKSWFLNVTVKQWMHAQTHSLAVSF